MQWMIGLVSGPRGVISCGQLAPRFVCGGVYVNLISDWFESDQIGLIN